MMRVILLGPPGCGKGSVGELIRAATGMPKISTGDLLRESVRKGSPLGIRVSGQLGKGGLVDDELVLELLRERLERPDCRAGYVLDGYPRNLAQAESLEALDGGRKEIAFEIQIEEETLVRRLAGRRICPSCEAIYNTVSKRPSRDGICDACGGRLIQRADDTPEVIKVRLQTYHAKTEPLFAHYEARGVLHRVDGNGTVDETFARIRAVLDGELRGQGRGPDRP
jgi:adenylate kinase